MLNLLKSDLYRLVHGKMLWVGLAALLAVVVGAAGLIWFATTPLFAEMVNEQAANNQAAANAGSTWNMQLTTPNNADLDAAEVEALNEKDLSDLIDSAVALAGRGEELRRRTELLNRQEDNNRATAARLLGKE